MYRTLAMISLAAFGAAGLLGAGAQAGTYAGTSAYEGIGNANTAVERVQRFDLGQRIGFETDGEGPESFDVAGYQDGLNWDRLERLDRNDSYEPGRSVSGVELKGEINQGTDEPALDIPRIQDLDGEQRPPADGVERKPGPPATGTEEPNIDLERIQEGSLKPHVPAAFLLAQTDEPAMDVEGIRKQDGAEYEPGRTPENIQRKGTAPQTETDEPATDMRRIEQLEGSEAGKGSGDVGRELKGPLDGTDEPAMEIEPPKKSEGGESR